jgi:hypothetical protein
VSPTPSRSSTSRRRRSHGTSPAERRPRLVLFLWQEGNEQTAHAYRRGRRCSAMAARSALIATRSSLLTPPKRGNYCAKNRIRRRNSSPTSSICDPASASSVSRVQPDVLFPKKRKGRNSTTWSPCPPWSPSHAQCAGGSGQMRTGDRMAAGIQHHASSIPLPSFASFAHFFGSLPSSIQRPASILRVLCAPRELCG